MPTLHSADPEPASILRRALGGGAMRLLAGEFGGARAAPALSAAAAQLREAAGEADAREAVACALPSLSSEDGAVRGAALQLCAEYCHEEVTQKMAFAELTWLV